MSIGRLKNVMEYYIPELVVLITYTSHFSLLHTYIVNIILVRKGKPIIVIEKFKAIGFEMLIFFDKNQ